MKKNNAKNTFRMLTLISQFSLNMLVPICLCFFVGMWLDRLLGTSYLSVVLFFVGAIAGFRNVYVFARQMTKQCDDSEDKK